MEELRLCLGGGAVRLQTLLAFLLVLSVPNFAVSQAPEDSLEPETSQQAPRSTASPSDVEAAEVAARRQRISEQLSEPSPGGTETESLDSVGQPLSQPAEREALQRIDQILAQQLTALERARALASERQQMVSEAEVGAEAFVGHPPPFALEELDRVLDLRRASAARLEALSAAVGAAGESLAEARKLFDELERSRRQIRDSVETARDELAAAQLRRRLRLAQLESRAGQDRIRLRELQLANARDEAAIQQLRLERLGAALEEVRDGLLLRPDDLQALLLQLDQERFDLSRIQESARLEAHEAESRWTAAQNRLETATEPDPVLREVVETRRLALQVAQRRLAIIERQLARVEQAKIDVELRYRLLAGQMPLQELRRVEPEVAQRVSDLERQARNESNRVLDLRQQIESLETRLEEPSLDPAVADLLRERRRDLEDLIALNQGDLRHLERMQIFAGRLMGEIGERAQVVTAGEWIGLAWGRVRAVWSYELAVVQDSPITVGKVLVALILLGIGCLVSKLFSRMLGARVFPRVGLDKGASTAFQTLVFYLLLVIFFFWALRLVHIPLTVFTVLGGALAIGLGFGSQNIVNNFISGLILMAERPIKAGDIVEVEGTYGQVERIGTRSTRIRSGDNTHVIAPNSSFLEKNVLNWTLSDNDIRTSLDVGVAYGSPTEEVRRLMQQAAAEHPRILKSPKPEVLFMDFGDNALLFRAYFWIRTQGIMDRRRVESDLRFEIDRLFRAARITIAFPQRDVHLDTLKTLDVRLLTDEDTAAE